MNAKREFVPEDERDFSPSALETLRTASRHVGYLINEGYDLKQAVTFVGNHFLLSERQRLAIIRQTRPHSGLFEFSGYYGLVSEFLDQSEEEWMSGLISGCQRIGRSVNDTRGLFHSFRDCREQMVRLFEDLVDMIGASSLGWEIAFEFRLKRARHVRIYADVLVITEGKVFSLEFKMKDAVDPAEVAQAAKYVPYLEIVFGPDYEVIPALVLTAAKETFDFVSIGECDAILPVCSGDMLFNVFDEYLGFLSEGE